MYKHRCFHPQIYAPTSKAIPSLSQSIVELDFEYLLLTCDFGESRTYQSHQRPWYNRHQNKEWKVSCQDAMISITRLAEKGRAVYNHSLWRPTATQAIFFPNPETHSVIQVGYRRPLGNWFKIHVKLRFPLGEILGFL